MATGTSGIAYCISCKDQHVASDTCHESDKEEESLTWENDVLKKVAALKDAANKCDQVLEHNADKSCQRHYSFIREEIDQLSRRIKIHFIVKKRRYIRIGSWNIQHQYKYKNAILSICNTIIHHNLDVVAIQETSKDEKHLDSIVTELNEISGIRYEGNRCKNKPNIAGGFVWKSSLLSKVNNFDKLWNLSKENQRIFQNYTNCVKFIIDDDKNNFSFFLFNFHLTACDYRIKEFSRSIGRDTNKRECDHLYKIIDRHEVDLPHTILLGDFNTVPELKNEGRIKFEAMFTEKEPTNTKKTHTYDNVLLTEKMKRKCLHHEVGNIYDKDGKLLTKYSDAKKISDHLPIWVDIPFIAL